MAEINKKEIKNVSQAELVKEVANKREELRKFRFGSTGSKVKNVKLGRTVRKDIARFMTELNARKIADSKTKIAVAK